MNLYVGNLAKIATQDDLWEAFNIYADVTNITIVKDRVTGEPLGYAFLEIPVKMEALIAMKEMNGKEVCGQAVIVNEARPHRRRDDRGGYRDRPPSRESGSDYRDRPPREGGSNWSDRPPREGGSSWRDRPPREDRGGWSDRPREDRGNWRDRPPREGGSDYRSRPPREGGSDYRDRPPSREGGSDYRERPPREGGGNWSDRPPRDNRGGYGPRKPRW